MLSPAAIARPLAPLERLTAARPPAARSALDWTAPIDRSRWFFCETLTPLFYTPVYRELGAEHRRRYSQLTGMLSNELILLLETGVLALTLEAVLPGADEPLRAAVARFAADERRHAETWRRLNRLSEPRWYAGTDRVLCRMPAGLPVLVRHLARHSLVWPVLLWLQLSQEERSIEISRRCARVPADRMEPRYAAAYREHLRDEVHHVQIDCHLLERFYATRPAPVRRLTARLLRRVLGSMFLRPSRSTVGVVRVLATEYPELRRLLPRMIAELRALPETSGEYQHMMYSREATPVTFAWFDRFPEMHTMRRVLPAYQPATTRSVER